ncbi:hypothetical protein MTO96_036764 [Rhipicephalus appendiculatus]
MCTYAYVTYRDLRSISSLADQTVIAVKAPPETRLEVPDPHKGLQIWLKSEKGEIEVYLSNPEDPVGLVNCDAEVPVNSQPSSSSSGDYEEAPAQSAVAGPSTEEVVLKRALISEEDDLGPMGGRQLLVQTEDQLLADSFVQLEPPPLGGGLRLHSRPGRGHCRPVRRLRLLRPLPPRPSDGRLLDFQSNPSHCLSVPTSTKKQAPCRCRLFPR